jgi:hypothetical protein
VYRGPTMADFDQRIAEGRDRQAREQQLAAAAEAEAAAQQVRSAEDRAALDSLSRPHGLPALRAAHPIARLSSRAEAGAWR